MKTRNLWKTKTTWAGIAGLVAAIGGAATGEMALADAIQLGIVSLMGIFGRHALLTK